MGKLKKLLLVAERKYWKMMSYLNGEKYKDGYPNYLRKIGINIPTDYRGGYGFIAPDAHFDGNDYSLITIGKNTTISTKVEVLTHDYSIAVGLKTLEVYEPKARFLKPVKIGNSCFIGERTILLPGCEIGDNCIIGSGAVVSGKIPPNSVAVGAPCRVISNTNEWAKKHVMRGDFVDVDVEGIRSKVIGND